VSVSVSATESGHISAQTGIRTLIFALQADLPYNTLRGRKAIPNKKEVTQ